MKNIHVLPTDKPSRLYLSDYGKELNLSAYPLRNYTTGQHIYITNSEEIKIGDYYYLPRTNSVYKCIEDPTELNLERRLGVAKIILTTDQDLIKDGVQTIDDEFLEWFVNNPSCKEVEIELFPKFSNNLYGIIIPKEEPKLSNICIKCGVDLYALEGKFVCLKHPKECKGIYLSKETLLIHAAQKKQEQEILEEKLAKIVSKEPSKFWAESDERARIREEQKQHLIDMMKSDEELGLYDEPKQDEIMERFIANAKQQETLEEAVFRKYKRSISDKDSKLRNAFIEGAKWQQERLCDSEVIQRIRASKSDAEARRIIRTI